MIQLVFNCQLLNYPVSWHCFSMAPIRSLMVVFLEMPVTHFFLSATQMGISALAIRADELTVCPLLLVAFKSFGSMLLLFTMLVFWCVPIPDLVIVKQKVGSLNEHIYPSPLCAQGWGFSVNIGKISNLKREMKIKIRIRRKAFFRPYWKNLNFLCC